MLLRLYGCESMDSGASYPRRHRHQDRWGGPRSYLIICTSMPNQTRPLHYSPRFLTSEPLLSFRDLKPISAVPSLLDFARRILSGHQHEPRLRCLD